MATAIAFAYLYSFPYFEKIHSANELPRAYLTMAMVDEGTFAIDSGVARWGPTVDVSPSRGHQYSNKAPGSSMLAMPGYVLLKAVKAATGGAITIGEIVWVGRVTTGVLPTLLFLVLLWRFWRRFAPAEETRVALVVAYGLGTMAMTYSMLFMSHQLAAVLIGTAFVLSVKVVRGELGPRWLVAVGLAAGAAPLCDYQAAFAGIPLGIYLGFHLVGRAPRDWRGLGLAVGGAAIPIAVLLVYHWRAFGSPLRTGYHASETFAHFHQRGFLGLDGFRWDAFVGSTVAADNGLLFLSPFLALAGWGWVLMARRRMYWLLGVTFSVVAIYIGFVSSIAFWRGGWQIGPRYIAAMIPFAMVPIAVAMSVADRRWWTRGIAWGLIAVAVVGYGMTSAQFPYFPEKFDNPLFELTLRLYGDGYAPYSAGWALGLRGALAYAPHLLALAVALGIGLLPTRSRWRSALVAVVVAALMLSIYSALDDGGLAAERAYRFVTSTYPE